MVSYDSWRHKPDNQYQVLILIVVEDGLVRHLIIWDALAMMVLILIVVEDGLVHRLYDDGYNTY